ncbi:MAG TPA: S8 family serine peptidase [Candidatus Dormibacteraeota bacterium]|nr:S8 family serine peptidase [Candidatus Dormibacteraeota bacterium]
MARTRRGTGFSALPVLLAGLLLTQVAAPALAAGGESLSRATAALGAYLGAHRGQPVPVIVETSGAAQPVAAQVAAAGGQKVRGLTSTAFSAIVSPATLDRLRRSPAVARINVDAPVRLLGSAVDASDLANRYERVSQIPAAWRRGLDGTGIQVAVIDSGVYPHDDLVRSSQSVPRNSGNRLLALTTNPDASDAIDHLGHGTHVAGIIGGNGYDSGGQYIGVAPNSLLVSVKVSDDAGNLDEGDVITGLEWVYQANRHGMRIRVVNLSLASSTAQSYNDSALDAMVEKLWTSGVVVVASSGSGGGDGVLYAPGNDPYAITVGSVDDGYQTNLRRLALAPWSPQGQTQDGYAKPEVVADGAHVVSLLAPGSALAAGHPGNVVGDAYFKMGGTSMAAPQVTGLAALMLQANPRLGNDVLKQRLVDGSTGFGRSVVGRLLGNLDHGGLVNSAALSVDSAPANAGLSLSAAFDPRSGAIRVGDTWWQDATWPNASWNTTSWNTTSWNTTSWNNTSWNGTDFSSTSWNSTSWNSTSWNSTSWNSTSWNSTSWNSTSWNSDSGDEATFQ